MLLDLQNYSLGQTQQWWNPSQNTPEILWLILSLGNLKMIRSNALKTIIICWKMFKATKINTMIRLNNQKNIIPWTTRYQLSNLHWYLKTSSVQDSWEEFYPKFKKLIMIIRVLSPYKSYHNYATIFNNLIYAEAFWRGQFKNNFFLTSLTSAPSCSSSARNTLALNWAYRTKKEKGAVINYWAGQVENKNPRASLWSLK